MLLFGCGALSTTRRSRYLSEIEPGVLWRSAGTTCKVVCMGSMPTKSEPSLRLSVSALRSQRVSLPVDEHTSDRHPGRLEVHPWTPYQTTLKRWMLPLG